MDAFLASLISKYGVVALAVLGAAGILANRVGWVTLRFPALAKRQDDKVIEQLMGIVEKNTAAFVALKATMDDSKGITIQVANTLNQVQTAIATLSGQVMGRTGRAP